MLDNDNMRGRGLRGLTVSGDTVGHDQKGLVAQWRSQCVHSQEAGREEG